MNASGRVEVMRACFTEILNETSNTEAATDLLMAHAASALELDGAEGRALVESLQRACTQAALQKCVSGTTQVPMSSIPISIVGDRLEKLLQGDA